MVLLLRPLRLFAAAAMIAVTASSRAELSAMQSRQAPVLSGPDCQPPASCPATAYGGHYSAKSGKYEGVPDECNGNGKEHYVCYILEAYVSIDTTWENQAFINTPLPDGKKVVVTKRDVSISFVSHGTVINCGTMSCMNYCTFTQAASVSFVRAQKSISGPTGTICSHDHLVEIVKVS